MTYGGGNQLAMAQISNADRLRERSAKDWQLDMPSGGSKDVSSHSQQAQNSVTGASYSGLYSNGNIWNSNSLRGYHGRGPSIGSREPTVDHGSSNNNAAFHNNTDRSSSWNTTSRQNNDGSRPVSTSPTRTRDNGFPKASTFGTDSLSGVGIGLRNGYSNRVSGLQDGSQQQQPIHTNQARAPQDSYFPPMPTSSGPSNPPSRQSQPSPAFQQNMSNGRGHQHSHSSSFVHRHSTHPSLSNTNQGINNRAFGLNQQIDDGFSAAVSRPRTLNTDAAGFDSVYTQSLDFNPSSQPWQADTNTGFINHDLNAEALTNQLAALKRPSAENPSPGPGAAYRLDTGPNVRGLGQNQSPWSAQPMSNVRDQRINDANRRPSIPQMPANLNMAAFPMGYPFANVQQGQFAFNPYAQLTQALSNTGFGLPQSSFPFGGNMAPIRQQTTQDPMRPHRSDFLNEFLSSTRASRRWELKDIREHIVEFSGDQYGSRFIQQKLETANSDEKEQVFQEIDPNAVQLMRDVFGNYVVQKLFEHGSQVQKKVLAEKMKGKMVELSTQAYACRVVQKALEHILVDQQAALVQELEADVTTVAQDVSGNHVIQKIIEVVPRSYLDFIMNAFRGSIFEISTQQYGCRVIQRLMEYGTDEDREIIMKELQPRARLLIIDSFGNYVAQNIIEKGRPEDRQMMIQAALEDLVTHCKHKFASNVVEKCIKNGNNEVRSAIREQFMRKSADGNSLLPQMIRDNYGNYVIKTLLGALKNQNVAEWASFAEEIKPLYFAMKKSSNSGTQKQIQNLEDLLGLGPHSPKQGRQAGDARSTGSAPGLASQSNSTPSSPHSTAIDTPALNDGGKPQGPSLNGTHGIKHATGPHSTNGVEISVDEGAPLR